MTDRIKLAEDTIKYLKDFIEIEKFCKKVVTDKARFDLVTLSSTLVERASENITKIKGE